MQITALVALLALPQLASAAPLDDYASRPGWACAYGQERTACGGPGIFEGIEAEHSVVLCGDEQAICGVTYKATGEDLSDTILTWAGAFEGELGTDWLLQLNPAAWTAAIRANDEIATLEIGAGYVTVNRVPAPDCDSKTASEKLQPLLPTVLRFDTSTEWPIIKTQTVGAMHSTLVERALEGPMALDATQHAQLAFLSSEAFACYAASNKAAPMDAVRGAFAEWRAAQAMDPKEIKAIEKAKRVAARKAKGRDIQSDGEDLPDELVPEEEGEDIW